MEMGQQVAMIGDIFSQAERVLVWLGKPADNSELVFRDNESGHSYNPKHHSGMVRQTKLHYQSWKRSWKPGSAQIPISRCCEPLSKQAEDSRPDAWTYLLQRAYWSRLWTVQEVLKAKSVLVHCGDRSRDWDSLVTSNMAVWYETEGFFDGVETTNRWMSTDEPSTPLLASFLLHPLSDLDRQNFRSQTLFDSMYRFGLDFECQDRSDKVYALLSISNLGELFEPDYTLQIPHLFLRTYILDYSGDPRRWAQETASRRWRLHGYRNRPHGPRFVYHLFSAMDLSGPKICKVVGTLFTLPISHSPGGDEAIYAAPLLIAAQFHTYQTRKTFPINQYEKAWRRSYDEVMLLVGSNPRAVATELARRLRAEIELPSHYLVGPQ